MIADKTNDVPENPPSIKFNGVKNRTTPTALIIPATVNIKKFLTFKFIFFIFLLYNKKLEFAIAVLKLCNFLIK